MTGEPLDLAAIEALYRNCSEGVTGPNLIACAVCGALCSLDMPACEHLRKLLTKEGT